MGVPRNWWNIENAKDDEDKLRSIGLFLKDVYNILLKNVSFSDNIRGAIVDVEFTVANEDLAIRHGLDFIPSYYLVCAKSAAVHVYDGSQDADKTYIYLRASAEVNATLFLF